MAVLPEWSEETEGKNRECHWHTEESPGPYIPSSWWLEKGTPNQKFPQCRRFFQLNVGIFPSQMDSSPLDTAGNIIIPF
jgi:hypothetical protein